MSPARGSRRPPATRGGGCVQAWIGLLADDPVAVSALAVARARLAAGRRLASLRRLRLLELSGPLPGRESLEDLLRRSTWFYNPHKERLVVRASRREPPPLESGEQAVLVVERGGARRAAAERWWLHETGQAIDVREGVAWILGFEAGEEAATRALELAVLSGHAQGLLCNPNAQDHAVAAAGAVPLPWIGAVAGADEGGKP